MLVIFLAGVEIDELLRKDASAGEEGIIGVLRYRRWRVGPVDALFVRATGRDFGNGRWLLPLQAQ